MSKKRSTIKKLIIWFPVLLIVLYMLLLIPGSSPPRLEPGEKSPFIWNKDEYWSSLETKFREAKEMPSEQLQSKIDTGLKNISYLTEKCENSKPQPDDPILDSLEAVIFETAPLVAARPDPQDRFTSIQKMVRLMVKHISRDWDMDSIEARNRLYRLLYGTRIAAEEILLQNDSIAVKEPINMTYVHSATPSAKLLGVTIHSGDILVSRGGAPTSALIARGNDYPGNFSHVALVHVDSLTHKVSIIESHIEIGVAIADIEKYLKDTKLRIMVLRLRPDLKQMLANPMLPHQTATEALERAQREHIPYDFEMDFNNPDKLFCSEVASSVYADNGITLWMGLSHISSVGVRNWLAAFGVKHFETQEPSDLEYDPQLGVVAEWRDPELLYKDHLDNAVIDVMLEKADQGLEMDYDLYMLPFARLAKGYSMIKNLWGGAGPVPEGMSATSALKNEWFSEKHRLIKERLIEKAEAFERANHYRPPYWTLVNMAREAMGGIL